MGEFLEALLCIGLLALLFTAKVGQRVHRIRRTREAIIEARETEETKESLDHFTHQHTPYWAYLKDIIPWRTRLRLSRFRGKKWALTWRIKIYAFFSGLGPQVARWLLEEYMITAKLEDLPAPDGSWRCTHCGCHNADTAIFCKDCGEYK